MVFVVVFVVVLLALQAEPTSGFWFTPPPECGGQCYMPDNGHPLAKCPVEVLRNVVSDEQANALIAMVEVSEGCGNGRMGTLALVPYHCSLTLARHERRLAKTAFFCVL